MLKRSLTATVWCLAIAGLLGAAPLAPTQDADESIEARLLRTWMGDEVTVVDGLASVPLSLLAVSTDGAYRFELEVYDSDGNQLATDGWEKKPDSRIIEIDRPDAALLETFRFAVKPGSYEVVVRAYPTDVPDMVMEVRLALDGYAERPDVSDLFLAYRVEPIDENSGGSRYPVTHSGFGIGVSVETVVLSDEPELYYYLELYGGEEQSRARVSAEIVGVESGRVFYRTPQREVFVVGTTPFAGPLSLAGLPPGDYELVMNVEEAGTSRSRQSTFRMIDRSTIAAAEVELEEGYFFSLPESEIEGTFGGVVTMLSEGQRRGYETLPLDAKRRFLTQFFVQHDPDPSTPENPFLDEYLERIEMITARFTSIVGQEDRPPWTLPRGRIMLKYGEPTDAIINNFPAQTGGATLSGADEPAYEIWYYGKSTGYIFLFVAEDRFGTYRLIYSTDPWEKTLADWRQRVGNEAIQDLRQNFGIQVDAGSNTN